MPGDHASDDKLEEYCLGGVPENELQGIEEHLLMCPACQEHLRAADRYVRTMRSAISMLASAPAPAERWWEKWFGAISRPIPATALAGLAAVTLICVVIPSLRDSQRAATSTVTLQAMRGGGDSLRVSAPEKTPLILRLDLTGLDPLPSYQVRIVDAMGTQVFETESRPNGTVITLNAPGRFGRGSYWVRLYNRNDPATLAREFSLELQK